MKNILIISEDCTLNNHLVNCSNLTNFHIITTFNYQEGIKLISEQYPDIIITDLDINQEKNYRNLKTIRELIFSQKILIILLYNQIYGESCLKIWELGISLFFNKMIKPNTLINIIEKALLNI